MKAFFLALIFAACPAFAAKTYNLKIDWSVEGMPKVSSTLAAKEGQMKTLTKKYDGKEYFLEVVANAEKKSVVVMKFAAGTVAKNGEKLIISTPQVITKERSSASITVTNSETHKEQVSISVYATKAKGIASL